LIRFGGSAIELDKVINTRPTREIVAKSISSVGASTNCSVTSIVDAKGAGGHIAASNHVILRLRATVALRGCCKGSADAERDNQGHNHPFHLFHTNCFK